MTETGFVRVSSNDSALTTSVRPIDAIEHLNRLRVIPGHVFWVDGVEGVVGHELNASRVLGHRQVSDAHLVSIAIANAGTVVTFDKGMRSLVDEEHARHITLIAA
jgi:predicted nucleic acid-binding protein